MNTPPGNPLMMPPQRRPVVVRAPRPPRPRFVVATGVPRRGWADAVVWPDTGVLLSMGVEATLPFRFGAHYRARARLAGPVARELRLQARPKAHADPSAVARQQAAAVAASVLLLGRDPLPTRDLTDADLKTVDAVAARLAALSDDPTKRHGGEATCIVLAAREATEHPATHLLLTNDGGASTVAHERGLSSRHAADVLAEMSCADPALDAGTCWRHHRTAVALSGIPGNARPRGEEAFRCEADGAGRCPACDRTGPAGPVSP